MNSRGAVCLFVSLLTLCLDPPLWAAGHSWCLHQTGKGLPARNHLYCGAETPSHPSFLCWQEWASEWGIEEVTVPLSCLPSFSTKEAVEMKSGDLVLGLSIAPAPFFPLTLVALPLLLCLLCFPLLPSSLLPLYLISLLPAPWPIDPIYRPAPRDGKGNFHLWNFCVPDTVHGVFLTAALWGRYCYLQFNLRKVK